MDRISYANEMFSLHPEMFSTSKRESIVNGVVTLGMTPFEARLAGGAFTFRVVADSKVWPKHADPFRVMWAQSTQPDSSEIWMTFKNETQFPDRQEAQTFRVSFTTGVATNIEHLKETQIEI